MVCGVISVVRSAVVKVLAFELTVFAERGRQLGICGWPNLAMENYECIRVLGTGSSGKAYLVRQKHSKQLCVMKEIKCKSQAELKEAMKEAQFHATVSHPHIIQYYELFQHSKKTVFIIMEYAQGGDLQAHIKRKRTARQFFPEKTILKWLIQAVCALQYLHQLGKIHRDIKAGNLFLDAAGNIKLGDFGIARTLEENATRMSARTCVTPVGTPLTMAPEIAAGDPYGQKVDIWGLGCVTYELAQLKPPFMAQSLNGLLSRIRKGMFDRNYPKHISQPLTSLIERLLEQDPNSRPNASDILEIPFLAAMSCDYKQKCKDDSEKEAEQQQHLQKASTYLKSSKDRKIDIVSDLTSLRPIPSRAQDKGIHLGRRRSSIQAALERTVVPTSEPLLKVDTPNTSSRPSCSSISDCNSASNWQQQPSEEIMKVNYDKQQPRKRWSRPLARRRVSRLQDAVSDSARRRSSGVTHTQDFIHDIDCSSQANADKEMVVRDSGSNFRLFDSNLPRSNSRDRPNEQTLHNKELDTGTQHHTVRCWKDDTRVDEISQCEANDPNCAYLSQYRGKIDVRGGSSLQTSYSETAADEKIYWRHDFESSNSSTDHDDHDDGFLDPSLVGASKLLKDKCNYSELLLAGMIDDRTHAERRARLTSCSDTIIGSKSAAVDSPGSASSGAQSKASHEWPELPRQRGKDNDFHHFSMIKTNASDDNPNQQGDSSNLLNLPDVHAPCQGSSLERQGLLPQHQHRHRQSSRQPSRRQSTDAAAPLLARLPHQHLQPQTHHYPYQGRVKSRASEPELFNGARHRGQAGKCRSLFELAQFYQSSRAP
eukprot:gene1469-4628_t